MALKLLVIALILIVCITVSKITNRYGIPSLLIFMALGMMFGSDGLFKIPFDNYILAEKLCSILLIFIMFYGGFGTNWKMAKPVFVKATLLATIGVVMTAVLTALFCHFVLRMNALESFLMGSVISSTDAASVFSILRSKKLNLKYSTSSLLEVESGSNDPASYMLTVIALGMLAKGGTDGVVWLVIKQMVLGIGIGLLAGVAVVYILKKVNINTSGVETLFVLAAAVFTYALPTVFEGNGYLAVYVAGLIIGNSKFKNKVTLVHFFDGLTDLSQVALFFSLGLLAFPSQMGNIILPAIAIFLFMTFISRPIAVFTIMAPMKSPIKQSLVVSWAGLRGAASIVFAIMATVSDAYMKMDIYHIVFCICLMSVTFQGTLLPFISKKCDMIDDEDTVLKTFNDYQAEAEVQLIKLNIEPEHPWIGKTVMELPLTNMLIVMIKRGDEIVIPSGPTEVMEEDTLVMSGEVYRDDIGVYLQETEISKGHKWIGKKLMDIDLSVVDFLVVVIRKDNGELVIPKGETVIEKGDVLIHNDISGFKRKAVKANAV